MHEQQRDRDAARDEELLARGVRTLRSTNEQARQDLAGVLAAIQAATRQERR